MLFLRLELGVLCVAVLSNFLLHTYHLGNVTNKKQNQKLDCVLNPVKLESLGEAQFSFSLFRGGGAFEPCLVVLRTGS